LWGVRNRVSSENLGDDSKIVAETRFLGFWVSSWGVRNRVSSENLVGKFRLSQKPGFWDFGDFGWGLDLGGDSEIVAETRFLGFLGFWVGS